MAGLTAEETTWLEQYKYALAERFPGLVEEIILFGSKARGDAHEDSDIDLLVIIREGERHLKREVADLGDRFAIGTVALPSIMVYTRSEIDRMRELGSSFLESVYGEEPGPEIKIHEIHSLWKRAKQSLRAAQMILNEGLPEQCVHSACYVVFHTARATLLAHRVVSKKRSALAALFEGHLVNQYRIEQEWKDILVKAQSQQICADYDVRYEIDPTDAQQLIDDAERFMNRMAEYLLAQGIDVNAPPGDIPQR